MNSYIMNITDSFSWSKAELNIITVVSRVTYLGFKEDDTKRLKGFE